MLLRFFFFNLILEFLKTLSKSLELRVCHASFEDIAYGDVPEVVTVVLAPILHFIDALSFLPCCMYFCLQIPRYT